MSSDCKDQQLRRLIEDLVLENHEPAHIVVDAEGDIVFYSARTGKYLEPQVGTPSRQLVAMAWRGLHLDLGAALREAVERRALVTRERIEVDIDERAQIVRLTIEPLQASGSGARRCVPARSDHDRGIRDRVGELKSGSESSLR